MQHVCDVDHACDVDTFITFVTFVAFVIFVTFIMFDSVDRMEEIALTWHKRSEVLPLGTSEAICRDLGCDAQNDIYIYIS